MIWMIWMCAFYRRLKDVHGLFHCLSIFIDASLFSLCFASEGHFWGEVARPRLDPATFGSVPRPRGGGEAAPPGESLGDCERQQWPGGLTGGCDGPLMAFAYLSYHIALLLLSGGYFVCCALRLPVVSSQSVKVS